MVQAIGATYSLTLEGKKEFCDLFLLSFFKELSLFFFFCFFLLSLFLRTCLCECISHVPVKSRKGLDPLELESQMDVNLSTWILRA